jgi:hypothetical protein
MRILRAANNISHTWSTAIVHIVSVLLAQQLFHATVISFLCISGKK